MTYSPPKRTYKSRRQTDAQVAARRACQHEWQSLLLNHEERHAAARRAGWRRHCPKCDSYSR